MNKEICIMDKRKLQKKIEKIKQAGLSSFHVVSDFDRTLTKAFYQGKKTQTTISLIRDGKYLTPDYPEKAYALYDKYRPAEISETMPRKEKNRQMQEWWETHLKLMIEKGMNKSVVEDIVKKGKIQPREGSLEMLDILYRHKIPMLIFSAGLGNIIESYLKSENRLYSNIHVISNFFNFNKQGKITGYKHKIIHVFNKNEFQIKNHEYYNEVKNRKNVLLIGDSLDDLEMVEGLEHNTILKVCFLNEDTEKNLKQFSEQFDVLILNDGAMDYVSNLIKEILS